MRSFNVSVGVSNQLALQFLDRGGADPNFVLNALDIRPASGTNSPATITLTGPASPPPADGSGSDTINGGGVPLNALITVSSNLGTITTADADPNYAGIQVMADSSGNFSFTLKRPTGTGSGATITANEVTGQASGSLLQAYSVAATRPPCTTT